MPMQYGCDECGEMETQENPVLPRETGSYLCLKARLDEAVVDVLGVIKESFTALRERRN